MLTDSMGMCAFLVRGISRKNPGLAAMMQPLSLLEVEESTKRRGDLHLLKESRRAVLMQQMAIDPSKMAVAMFTAEILERSMAEHQPNEPLFEFIWNVTQAIDVETNISFYPTFIIGRLIRFLGIHPPARPPEQSESYLDLLSGQWVRDPFGVQHAVEYDLGQLLCEACEMTSEQFRSLSISREEHRKLLEAMVDYLRLHISGQKEFKTLPVLREIFA